ncbi:protein disulfide-isomerase A5 isoform X1 [Eurytemora carolleeae]|nr:protein disulfide-isomerase A5 isoform X1 [Eurytemora carolleeae]XP_023325872.1 protein disulfide-isomerase A5 isoform X1 [Eurytemora carolleeae]|eukprot:XP_023325871.1 protein disulfide-isomerase A5-like isoform X1 [Eurytemora affinis]
MKAETGKVLIMFYAPWCGHCKRMKPDYQVAAGEMKGKAVLAAMDVNKPENTPISRKFNITGFPTLLYFKDGQMKFQYEGGNNKQEIIKFLEDPTAAPVAKPKETSWADEPSEVVHLTDATFDEFLANEPSALIMFYAPWCGHCKRAKPHFVTASARMKKEGIAGKLAAVDCTQETELSKRFEIKGFPSIQYFKDGEFAFNAGDAREEEAIIKFMSDPKEPPPPPPPEKPWSEEPSDVVHLGEEDFKTFLKKKKHVLVIFYAPWCGHCKRAKPEFSAAAAAYKDNPKVEFVAVDCTIHKSVCSAYNVNGFPSFKYFSYFNKEQKDYDGGRTEKDFVNYMKDPQSPTAGQAPAPPSPEEDWSKVPGNIYLKHLKGAEFEEFLRFKDTVLIMFYAPWCGHCKSMKPEYARAAEELTKAEVPHVLATVDATQEQELGKRFNIRGYPTLKLFRRGVEVEDYSGGRKSADFVKYIRLKVSELRNEL